MSTDESTQDAPTEPAATNVEATESGAERTAETSDPSSDASAAEGQASAEATPGEQPKKKRRRRRRKKKPAGAAAGAENGTTEAPSADPTDEGEGDEDGDDEAAEGSAEPDATSGAQAKSGAPKKAKRKPKPKPPIERPAFNVGDEVFGRVSKVTRDAVLIDVAGGKAVGLYDRAQLIQVPPVVGEQFIAKVKGYSSRGGMLILGPEPYDTQQTRLELRAALETKNPIEAWVTGLVKGGLEVEYNGMRAFAPASHVELMPGGDLSGLLGEKLSFIVTHYGKKGRDVVLSRKDMLEKEYGEKRQVELAKLEPGMVCKALVRNVLQWGAFAALPDYGDVEGVIHMSEVSHDRGERLDRILSPGQEIEVKVLRVDEKGKLWLSRKATIEDPWATVAQKYSVGSIHRAKIARLTEFGAFIQLEPGIDGLCHVADLSFEPVEHPNKVVREGDELEVIVAGVDREKHKVTLHPAPPEEERGMPRPKIALNHMIKVQVKQIKEAGLGVRIIGLTGRSSRGFIPAGQTGTPRGTDLRKTFPIGTTLDAKVIEFDPRRGEARLSIRALKDDEEKNAYREYRKKVAREATFGTFADLLKKNLER
jgi:small subunit ribosomal protein S1